MYVNKFLTPMLNVVRVELIMPSMRLELRLKSSWHQQSDE